MAVYCGSAAVDPAMPCHAEHRAGTPAITTMAPQCSVAVAMARPNEQLRTGEQHRPDTAVQATHDHKESPTTSDS